MAGITICQEENLCHFLSFKNSMKSFLFFFLMFIYLVALVLVVVCELLVVACGI